MISLAFNAAVSNEIASLALLQFGVINASDAAGCAQHDVVSIVVI